MSGVPKFALIKATARPKFAQSDVHIAATPDNAVNGSYPLGRFLYTYVNKHPNKPLPPLERAFMKLILSQEGQQVVIKDGYIPLPASVVEKQLKSVLAN